MNNPIFNLSSTREGENPLFRQSHIGSLEKALVIILISLALMASTRAFAGEEHGHSDDKKDLPNKATHTQSEKEHGSQPLTFSSEQMLLAGIRVLPLSSDSLNVANLNLDVSATATLVVDRDKTATLAPQLDVRVVARHVAPGQEVKKGDPLLTLGGAEVARAQAEYINAAAEWSRIRRMGEGSVSVSHRMQTQVDAELKRAILQSLNMTDKQIYTLASTPQAIGNYQLLAPIDGRVQQDSTMLGQVFSAGTPLMQLTDESHLWVEAQLTPAQAAQVVVGGKTLVQVGSIMLAGTIIGRSHELDSLTRTERVFVSIPNPEHLLHAGQFAELYFTSSPSNTQAATVKSDSADIVLPDAALTRSSDGDWQIFVQGDEGFAAIEVNVIQRQRGLSLVRSDKLASLRRAQSKVVVEGAFFLASEQAKSGFDIHAH
ncbi:efflux RND transporter periplasmic adaptor subunit [Shewanella sp. A25]|nr:efflux RND transporter periplasmic adaptor subunit [Shewanella shenzhenensis]